MKEHDKLKNNKGYLMTLSCCGLIMWFITGPKSLIFCRDRESRFSGSGCTNSGGDIKYSAGV